MSANDRFTGLGRRTSSYSIAVRPIEGPEVRKTLDGDTDEKIFGVGLCALPPFWCQQSQHDTGRRLNILVNKQNPPLSGTPSM